MIINLLIVEAGPLIKEDGVDVLQEAVGVDEQCDARCQCASLDIPGLRT